VQRAPVGEVNMPRGRYEEMVHTAKEYIAAGDIFQVVLAQRFSVETQASALAIYRALRVVNPSPYMYLLRLGELELVGASPELLVQVTGRSVSTRPIAGTRPRGHTPEQDQALETELREDPKELAEHAMLVDLGRNDIGRIARIGSVRVEELLVVERYSHVMHLTSLVSGELRPELGAVDALRACFPAGTVSGAPKVRAMELIAELERDRRGPYAGAVGYVGYDGTLDMAITIRTIVHRNGVASVQAGAGIVADSVPEREHEETRSKARALLRAVEFAERLAAERAPSARQAEVCP
jgi:anthranilate synthase component I